MECNNCIHKNVCVFQDDFKRFKESVSGEVYHGIFDLSCNEFLDINRTTGRPLSELFK